MSYLAIELVDDAALDVSDPSFTRTSREQWRAILNRVCRDLSSEYKLVEYEGTFDLVADATGDRYAYPEGLTQVRWVQCTATPDDLSSYYDLEEMYEDEWFDNTRRRYPAGPPEKAFYRQGFFHLYPKPDAAVLAGGSMAWFGLAGQVSILETQTFPLPDFLREHVVRGMVIRSLRSNRDLVAFQAEYGTWMQHTALLVKQMEDRSDVRRPALRPKSWVKRYQDQS